MCIISILILRIYCNDFIAIIKIKKPFKFKGVVHRGVLIRKNYILTVMEAVYNFDDIEVKNKDITVYFSENRRDYPCLYHAYNKNSSLGIIKIRKVDRKPIKIGIGPPLDKSISTLMCLLRKYDYDNFELKEIEVMKISYSECNIKTPLGLGK